MPLESSRATGAKKSCAITTSSSDVSKSSISNLRNIDASVIYSSAYARLSSSLAPLVSLLIGAIWHLLHTETLPWSSPKVDHILVKVFSVRTILDPSFWSELGWIGEDFWIHIHEPWARTDWSLRRNKLNVSKPTEQSLPRTEWSTLYISRSHQLLREEVELSHQVKDEVLRGWLRTRQLVTQLGGKILA